MKSAQIVLGPSTASFPGVADTTEAGFDLVPADAVPIILDVHGDDRPKQIVALDPDGHFPSFRIDRVPDHLDDGSDGVRLVCELRDVAVTCLKDQLSHQARLDGM
jgi:hypothetical protein